MLGCVIMAAGNAVRFGANKLEAELDGKPLIRRAFEAVPAGVFDRVAVVTQYPAVAALAREFGFEPVRNDRPGDGLSRTVRLGTQALAQCDGIAFLVADQPLLSASAVRAVVRQWREHPSCIVGAACGTRRGNPNVFPREFFPALCALEDRHAARPRLDYLRVVVMHRGGADDELDIRRDIHGRVAYLDVYAQAAQVARLFALGHVRAVYHQAHTRQHLRQRRHRDASRANEMAALAGFQVLFKVCHICSKPSKNLILSFP